MTPPRLRSPLLSVRAFTLVTIPVAAAIALFVFWRSTSPVIVELQITLYIVAAVLFAFLAVALYRGVRVQRSRADRPSWRSLLRRNKHEQPLITTDDALDVASVAADVIGSIDVKDIDLPDLSDSGDDLVGCLLAIVLWIGVTLLIIVLLPILIDLVWAVAFIVIAVLYWIFYRALRVVFIRSRQCRGNLPRSLGYAAFYTLLYTGWLFVVLLIVRTLAVKG